MIFVNLLCAVASPPVPPLLLLPPHHRQSPTLPRASPPVPPLLLPPPITGNPRLCPGPPPLLPAGGAATDLMTLQQGNQHLYARDATILTTYASALEE